MENEDLDQSTAEHGSYDAGAVNSLILDYYKKFGRKRDLEQYFSLSTAQSDIKDPSSTFWRRMKSENDSSDSGGKKSESSTELCRISIRCSLPDPTSSQEENIKTKSDSESPPIVTEEIDHDTSKQSDHESLKSDDYHSQKSVDVTLDTSMNKPFSPTSSLNSQRKLEWDSLADVGYGNESERKTSGSSLSTLERYAIKQQYSNNDSKKELGAPKAHSTFLESSDSKSKPKKGLGKKTTKIYKRDVDIVELNMPRISENQPQAINVNLTKHISFNVEKDGGVTVDNVQQNDKVSPEKVSVDTEPKPNIRNDKEIQTSLLKVTDKSSSVDFSKNQEPNEPVQQGIPVLITLNPLKPRRKTKYNVVRRRTRSKKRAKSTKRSESAKEKTGGQVSEAESFEYMPGHIYNQNQKKDATNPKMVDNKSSLESSGLLTTDSSKGSKLSFTKDLEKSIVLLRTALEKHHNDSDLKKKLIKEVVQRLLKSKYRDESSTEFLSGLSFRGKKVGLGETHYTTTSTSDANNTAEKVKPTRPKKSILRSDKFNANALASTSQSAPNLPFVSDSDKPISTNLRKHMDPSNTESDVSSKEKTSSDTAFAKTSSEELYQKYLEALKREELYKKHLKDKQLFLKQKLVSSENAIQEPLKAEVKANKRLQDLMKDLTRNNYDDGSGDASKLEGGLASNFDSSNNVSIRKQRSHSVFTLSSGNSESHNKKSILRNQILKEIKGPSASKDIQLCVCPFHSNNAKVCVADSSCQVNIECQCKKRKSSVQDSPKQVACVLPENIGKNLQYVCLCSDEVPEEVPENFLMYKCSRLINSAMQFDPTQINSCNNLQCVSTNTSPKNMVCEAQPSTSKNTQFSQPSDYKSIPVSRKNSHCSQTEMNFNLNLQQTCSPRIESMSKGPSVESTPRNIAEKSNHNVKVIVEESTRWMQTEISINPKILDPDLTDVAFISDDCCAKLINQGRREVSKSCSNTCFNANEDDECCQPRLQTEVCPMYNAEIDDRKTQINEDHLSDVNITTSCNVQDVNTDNFTIPIQGTNMTLMVSIGANTITAPNDEACSDTCSKGIVTEDICSAEKATCLTEDCTKGVQCQNTDIFKQINSNQCPCDSDVGKQEALKAYSTKTCLIGVDSVKSSTYPKCVQIHDRKPLVRSNTDTHNLRNYNLQTEINVKSQGINKIAKVQCDVGCGTDVARCSDSERVCESMKNKKRDIGTQGNLSEVGSAGSNTCSQTRNKSRPSFPIRSQQDKSDRSKKSEFDGISQKSRSVKTSPERSCSDKSRIYDKSPKRNPCSQPKPKDIAGPSNASNSEKSKKNDSDSGTISSAQYSSVHEMASQSSSSKDLVMDLIKNITDRYSKKDVERLQKRKCFKEIFTVLNYLLDTEDSSDSEKKVKSCDYNSKVSKHARNKYSSPSRLGSKGDDVTCCDCKKTQSSSCQQSQSQGEGSSCDLCVRKSRIALKPSARKTLQDPVSTRNKSPTRSVSRKRDKNVQCCSKNMKHFSSNTESSDVAILTEPSSVSTDTGAGKVLSKIKKQCEKYHQKRCKVHAGTKFDKSSTTSISGCQCYHCCQCKGHKCKSHRHRTTEKPKNKGLAYNLIIQTSDSLMCDDSMEKKCNQLKNIVLKVPRKCRPSSRVPFQEMSAKIERDMPCFREEIRQFPPKSAPNDSEFSTTEDVKKSPTGFTVREYLEQNRPDFVENCNQRQNSLKLISDCRANERAVKRELLSVQLQHSPLKAISENDLRQFAKRIGVDLRRRREPEKLISEREMKKHSEKIYKSLPEVVRKKEEARKENIKKTNLLMASLFNKNLQKKTLRGTVNLSNYSPVVKI